MLMTLSLIAALATTVFIGRYLALWIVILSSFAIYYVYCKAIADDSPLAWFAMLLFVVLLTSAMLPTNVLEWIGINTDSAMTVSIAEFFCFACGAQWTIKARTDLYGGISTQCSDCRDSRMTMLVSWKTRDEEHDDRR